jgi:MoxR-like ATPase
MQTDGTNPPATPQPPQSAPANSGSTQSTNVAKAAEAIDRLKQSVGMAMVGQSAVVEQVIVTLIASGHALIEGVPGLGKTLLVRALAQALSLNHARVQFTPDLMPSDITGHAILDPTTRELRVVKGPIFTQLLLADEINRAPAKTQSALLETMQEYQVTLEGQSHRLPQPFFVLATENPVESEGTYPLPEAQLDRFLFKIEIGYPGLEEESAIVVRTTANQTGDRMPLDQVKPCLNERGVLSLQQIAARQRVDDKVVDYAVRIVRATREASGLAFGASSRGAIALVRAARVIAMMEQREFVTPDDIKRIALPALRHRVALSPDAMLEGRKVDDLLRTVLDTVAAPRS